MGRLTVVGAGLGTLPFNFIQVPLQCSVSTTYYGTKNELLEVVALANAGKLRAEIEFFTLDQADEAYRRLRRPSLDMDSSEILFTAGKNRAPTMATSSPPATIRLLLSWRSFMGASNEGRQCALEL